MKDKREHGNEDRMEESFQKLVERIEKEEIKPATLFREKRMQWKAVMLGITAVIMMLCWGITNFFQKI